MANKTYTVARAMTANGQDYARGDTRELSEGDAAHLLASGALVEEGGKSTPSDKAEPSMTMTKAELVDMAEAEGVEIETDDNKADLVAKIEKARG